MESLEARVGNVDADQALNFLLRVAAPTVINALTPEERTLALTKGREGTAFRRLLSDSSIDPAIVAALSPSERSFLLQEKGRDFKKLLIRFTALCRQFEVDLVSVPCTMLAMALFQNEIGARMRVSIAQKYGNMPECGSAEQYLIGTALCQSPQGAIARSAIADQYRDLRQDESGDIPDSGPSLWDRFLSGFLLFGSRQDGSRRVRDKFVAVSNVVPTLAGYSTGTRGEVEQELRDAGLLDPGDDDDRIENVYAHDPS